MSRNAVMVCHHDLRLIVLSIVISIMAAFAARDLLGRINAARGQVRLAWLAGTIRKFRQLPFELSRKR